MSKNKTKSYLKIGPDTNPKALAKSKRNHDQAAELTKWTKSAPIADHPIDPKQETQEIHNHSTPQHKTRKNMQGQSQRLPNHQNYPSPNRHPSITHKSTGPHLPQSKTRKTK